MKLLKTTALIALFFSCYFQAAAQTSTPPLNEPEYNKPKLFAGLPDKLILNKTALESVFNFIEGNQVNKTLAAGFTLTGTVVSKADDGAVKSIVVRSTTKEGAAFTFTRFKNAEGIYSYTGRMLSKMAGDALVIEKEGADYVLRKKTYYDLVNE